MNSNKKITLMVSSLSGGGAEGVCVNIANNFAKRGWQVDLVILNLNNEAYRNRLLDSVQLVVLSVNHARYSVVPLLKYIYKNKPKIVLVFNYELSVILLILRSLFRFKFKIISRNINTLSIKLKQIKEQNFWIKYIVSNLIKYFYDKLDHVVNQCDAMRDDLIGMYPKLSGISSVINNPLSSYIENYVNKNDLTLIKKDNYILCVGRLEKQKAFHYAIETFAKISNKFPKLRLKIVGQGSLDKDLKLKAIHWGVSSRVDFEGFQKDIIPYYLYAKVTILTSLYEGYPNVLIESIALNTPVVSFDCPSGPSEIIQDGLNGYLVKYQDIDDLKNKVLITLSNKFNSKDLKNSIKKNQIAKVFKCYEKLIDSFI